MVGVDIDKDALAIAQENCVELNPYEEDICIDFVNANVLELEPGRLFWGEKVTKCFQSRRRRCAPIANSSES